MEGISSRAADPCRSLHLGPLFGWVGSCLCGRPGLRAHLGPYLLLRIRFGVRDRKRSVGPDLRRHRRGGARGRRIGRLSLCHRHGERPDPQIHHLWRIPSGLGIRGERRHAGASDLQRSKHLPSRDRGSWPGEFESPIADRVDNSNGPTMATLCRERTDRVRLSGEQRNQVQLRRDTTWARSTIPNRPGIGKGSRTGARSRSTPRVLRVAANDHNYIEGGNNAGLVTKFSNEVNNEYLGGSTWDCKCGEIRAMTVNPAGTKVYPTDPNATVASYESDGTSRF